MGIPDSFEGKTLMRKDVITQPLSFAANQDSYLLILPTPGQAYWFAATAIGAAPTSATVWTPTQFPGAFGAGQLFGDLATGQNDRSTNVDAFRYASLAVGLYPSSNYNQFAGSITCWKFPVRLTQSAYNVATTPATTVSAYSVSGLDSVTGTNSENYARSFIDGVFSQSSCSEPDFNFLDIVEGVNRLPMANQTVAQIGQFGVLSGDVLGVGRMDAILIRVSTPTGAVNSAILKVWNCCEYRVNTQSAFYQYAGTSPALDEAALIAYRRIAKSIPVAVTAAENSEFWNRVSSILRAMLGAASVVPGPVGMIASGIGGVVDFFRNLEL